MGKNNSKDFIVGSLVGGLIGAATALFLAPKSGKEIRDDLGQQASIVKGRTEKFTSQTLEKSAGLANVAKEKTVSLSQVVSEQSSQIMNKVRDLTNTTNEQRDVIETEVADALEQISGETPVTPKEAQAELPTAIVEAVHAIESDVNNEQPQTNDQVSSEDKVKTNS
ncbi:YtxH domain-containing protein [Metabacillus litoralis]|nr:YtxH domain-containing protein [Metabacillus litoralis]MCM3650769.1 YtxH domain-containing protein [Metabacillus litoralis]